MFVNEFKFYKIENEPMRFDKTITDYFVAVILERISPERDAVRKEGGEEAGDRTRAEDHGASFLLLIILESPG